MLRWITSSTKLFVSSLFFGLSQFSVVWIYRQFCLDFASGAFFFQETGDWFFGVFGLRPRVSVSLAGFFAWLFVHFGVSVAHFGGRRGENRGSEGDYVIRDMISSLLLGWIHTAMVYF